MQNRKNFDTYRLVKSEDLNHHGTLFAGRSAEWFVESGFIAATNLINPKELICKKLHGMHFSKPIKMGTIICYRSRIVHTGRSSLVAHIEVFENKNEKDIIVEGFITFVHVDENSKSKAHGIVIEPHDEESLRLKNLAIELKKIDLKNN